MSKSNESRLSDEKRQLKRALDDCEARATELEMNRRALEGEIQRLSMILTDKDTEIQVHQERCETLIRQIQVKINDLIFLTEIFFFVFSGSGRKMSIITIKC